MTGPIARGVMVRAACAALLLAAAGCTASPAILSLDDVAAERASAAEALGLQRFTEFIAINGARFAELDLELPQYQGLVEPEQWAFKVGDCVERVDTGVRLARQDIRVSVNYFGSVGDAFERIHWSVEGCVAQYGVIDPDAAVAGPIEADWLYHDTVVRLVPCLRGLGVSIPSLPPRDAFGESVAAGDVWNPVALAVPIAQHERVSAVCPSSSSELERQILAWSEARS
jgi:hypothetical protein